MSKYPRGFTLVELMITILIVALLLGVATPSLRALVQNNKVTGITNQLLSAVSLARNEAAKRGYNVTLCIRNTAGTGCDPTATDYGAGILVFTDYFDSSHPSNRTFDSDTVLYDLDKNGTPESAETLIMVTDKLVADNNAYTITNNRGAVTTSPVSAITYTPSGQVSGSRMFSLLVNEMSNAQVIGAVTINFAGRARSCVVKSADTTCP